ncbi:hypothetical protein QUF72_10600 [Desulfobacterales bacterium HSG2]|nr:hypothetical protein [Desulfobacterales bacterium HSG2]
MKKLITAFVIFVVCFTVNSAVYAQYFTLEQLNAFLTDERERWDVKGDGKIGLEEAIRALQVAAGMQADVIRPSSPDTDTGTINVLGRGNETYYIHDSTGSGDPLYSAGLNDEIELFPGTYTVTLNNSTQTVTVEAGESELLEAGNVCVAGISAGKFYVHDSMGNELDSAFAGNEINLLPGDYSIRVNDTEQSASVQAGEKTTVTTGTITVSSRFLTGNSRYYVYDPDGNKLSDTHTNKEIKFLPGTYTVSLHGTVQTAEVRAGEKTTLASGTVTVSSSFLTGNSTYYVYDPDGNKLSDTHTNKEIELFPGTYTVSLHDTVQTAEVRAGEKTTLEAGTVTVSSSLPDGNTTYYVYDPDGNRLHYTSTNKEIELFPGTYMLYLHDTERTAEVRAGEKTTLAAGTVTVSSLLLTENSTYYVYDTDGNRLHYTSTNKEIELFPGTYTLYLHDTGRTAEVRAGEKTTLAAGTVTVSSLLLTENSTYYVYDPDGNKLHYTSTNKEIELFPGTYTLSLHDTTQTTVVRAGEKTTLPAGTVTVSSSFLTGNSTYHVYDPDGKKLSYASTNKEIELFPGTYTLSLHDTVRTAEVRAGEKTTLAAGTVTVSGTGSSTYYVYDSTGVRDSLESAKTNEEVELFPGAYTLRLNDTERTTNVQAGEKTTLAAGTVTVSGTGNTTYYVYDSTGVGDSLESAKTNEEVELFPGAYTVWLNNTEGTADVQAGKKAALAAGSVTISRSAGGYAYYYVHALDGNQLYSSYSSSRKNIEFFPGSYTVTVGDNSQTVVVQAGEDMLVNF